MTMREVGRRLGVHHSWIGKVEIGERRLDVAEYVRVCRVLGADPRQGVTVIEAVLGPYDVTRSPELKAAESPAPYPAAGKAKTGQPETKFIPRGTSGRGGGP